MGNLRIRKVCYYGQKFIFESAIMDGPIALIEGDNGTGKSTFCNLIYFGLGGKVNEFKRDAEETHTQIVTDLDNYVELYIAVNGENFLLRRFFYENDITLVPFSEEVVKHEKIIELPVQPGEEAITKTITESSLVFNCAENADQTQVLPLNRSETQQFVFSDWMLEKLQISVVELSIGYQNFKINFTDLMRLMYHDQQPDPLFIYKRLDSKANFINDSELMRKAIFELLVGRTYSDYYTSVVALKNAEREKSIAKSLVDEYKNLADELRGDEEMRNKTFLENELVDKEAQLERLEASRRAFKRNRSTSSVFETDIGSAKSEIINTEIRLGELRDSRVSLYEERYRLTAVQNDTRQEIGEIQKVIHTHNQLNLFTSDTCPYCLSAVKRAEGHCVCGSSIDETQYERFFYTTQEYSEILKSKTKTLATIELAIEACSDEVKAAKAEQELLEQNLSKQKEDMRELLEKVDETVDLDALNNIDDKILEVRESMAILQRLIRAESKLDALQRDYDSKREIATECLFRSKELKIAAQRDISQKVSRFSQIYGSLMTETLMDCRSAHIKLEDYMPVINDGEYKEASARVPKRLMYYISMMQLSMTENDVSFPRFLLVDTPETAGIELDNLNKCVGQFSSLLEHGSNFQVIFVTGLKKYPASLKQYRILYMPTKTDFLLQKRES